MDQIDEKGKGAGPEQQKIIFLSLNITILKIIYIN